MLSVTGQVVKKYVILSATGHFVST